MRSTVCFPVVQQSQSQMEKAHKEKKKNTTRRKRRLIWSGDGSFFLFPICGGSPNLPKIPIISYWGMQTSRQIGRQAARHTCRVGLSDFCGAIEWSSDAFPVRNNRTLWDARVPSFRVTPSSWDGNIYKRCSATKWSMELYFEIQVIRIPCTLTFPGFFSCDHF